MLTTVAAWDRAREKRWGWGGGLEGGGGQHLIISFSLWLVIISKQIRRWQARNCWVLLTSAMRDRERQRLSIACFSLDSRTFRGLAVDVYLYLEMLCSVTYNSCYLAGFRKFWWDVYFVWKYFILWYITIVIELGLESFDEMFICIWKYFVLWHVTVINFRSKRRKKQANS